MRNYRVSFHCEMTITLELNAVSNWDSPSQSHINFYLRTYTNIELLFVGRPAKWYSSHKYDQYCFCLPCEALKNIEMLKWIYMRCSIRLHQSLQFVILSQEHYPIYRENVQSRWQAIGHRELRRLFGEEENPELIPARYVRRKVLIGRCFVVFASCRKLCTQRCS